MGKGKGGLPDRWLDYIAVGNVIRGVPIIACKVPLKEELVRYKLHFDQWFTPDILVERVPNVGCIVDLTATNRYYNPIVFTQRGIQHEKIFCAGHVIPDASVVQRFFQVLDDFLHNSQSRGKVLMVHCTHGLNRTGYLVSRYMVERRGFQPSDAIAAFNEARGHRIERSNYLEHLHQMSQQVCRNPIPLFQESSTSVDYNGHNQRGTFDQARLDWHRNQPPPNLANIAANMRPCSNPVSDNQERFQPSYSTSERSRTLNHRTRSPAIPIENLNQYSRPNSANHHGRNQSAAGSIPVVINQGRVHRPVHEHIVPPSATDQPKLFGWNPTKNSSSLNVASRSSLRSVTPSSTYQDRSRQRPPQSSYSSNDRSTEKYTRDDRRSRPNERYDRPNETSKKSPGRRDQRTSPERSHSRVSQSNGAGPSQDGRSHSRECRPHSRDGRSQSHHKEDRPAGKSSKEPSDRAQTRQVPPVNRPDGQPKPKKKRHRTLRKQESAAKKPESNDS